MWARLGLWEIAQDEVWQPISAPVSYVFYAAPFTHPLNLLPQIKYLISHTKAPT